MSQGNEGYSGYDEGRLGVPIDRFPSVGDHAPANASEWDIASPDGSRESIIEAYDREFLGGTALRGDTGSGAHRPNRR